MPYPQQGNDTPTAGWCQGQATDIEITAREILKLKDELYQILADHTGKPKDNIEHDADRDYWMTSGQAKEYGMVDEVLTKTIKKA